jgi:acetyl esterase/lipase
MHRGAREALHRSRIAERITRWLSLRAYGAVTRTLFRATTPPGTMRGRFERFGRTSRASMLQRHPAVVFGDHRVGQLAIESVRATPAPCCTILYLHGGAYVMGSAASYRSRAIRVSYRCDAEVLVPDYRLAPEHPFPAALEDAVTAWRLLTALCSSRPAFVAGDSAGGGLALSLMVRLRELGQASPRGAVLLSPWANLSEAAVAGPRRDLWLSPEHLSRWARYYVGQADPRDPLISPAFADLSRLAPVLVLVGEDEALAEETRRLVARARASGTDARLLVGEGMQHDWPLTLPWLPESRRAWKAIAGFIEERASTARSKERCREATGVPVVPGAGVRRAVSRLPRAGARTGSDSQARAHRLRRDPAGEVVPPPEGRCAREAAPAARTRLPIGESSVTWSRPRRPSAPWGSGAGPAPRRQPHGVRALAFVSGVSRPAPGSRTG